MGRRTALRHDLFNPEKRDSRDFRPGEPGQRPEEHDEDEEEYPEKLDDEEDYEADDFLRRVGQRHSRVPGCGPVTASSCGLWG